MKTNDISIESILSGGLLGLSREEFAPEGDVNQEDLAQAALEESDGYAVAESAFIFCKSSMEHMNAVMDIKQKFGLESDAPKKSFGEHMKAFWTALIEGAKRVFTAIGNFFKKLWERFTSLFSKKKTVVEDLQETQKLMSAPEVKEKVETAVETAVETVNEKKHMVIDFHFMDDIAGILGRAEDHLSDGDRTLTGITEELDNVTQKDFANKLKTEGGFNESRDYLAKFYKPLTDDGSLMVEILDRTVEFSLTANGIGDISKHLNSFDKMMEACKRIPMHISILAKKFEQVGVDTQNKLRNSSTETFFEKNPKARSHFTTITMDINGLMVQVSRYSHHLTQLSSKVASDFTFYLSCAERINNAAGVNGETA